MAKDKLYDQIIEEYKKCGSVKQTADTVGTTLVRAQRVLITEGLWRSDTSDAIGELYREGKTTQEIADELFISVKTVQAYLPYSKGFYSETEKSRDAMRSSRYRNRNRNAADNQVVHSNRKEEPYMNTKITPIPNNNLSKNADKYKVMKLRLELIMDTKDRHTMNVLRKYAKVKEGIIREIIVPSDISLHKLNYAIQRAFGWQNSHLHHFALPGKVFAELTEGKFDGEEDERYSFPNGSFLKWADYCGTYFRFPSEDFDDLYWDDDYEGNLSIKTWFRRKYNGANIYLGHLEHFVCAKKMTESFIKEYPVIEVDPYFTDPSSSKDSKPGKRFKKTIKDATVREVDIMFECGLGQLLERLPLNEVLRAKGDKKTSKAQLAKMVKERNILFEASRDKYIDMVNGITSSINDFPWTEDEVPVLPITDELIYRYDYGDGWGVKITCEEKYYFKDRLTDASGFVVMSLDDQVLLDETEVFNQKDERILDEESEDIVNTNYERKLKCTYSDGINVLDDVGGVYGFVDFLQELHEGEPEERESYKEWSSGQGWTGREIKPKSVL